MLRCRWYKGLLHRKIVSLVLFSYFVMIFLLLINLDIIQTNSKSEDSTAGGSLQGKGNSLKEVTSLLLLLKQLTLTHKNVLRHPENDTADLDKGRKVMQTAIGNITHAEPAPLKRPVLDLKHEKAGDFIVIAKDVYVYSAFVDDRKIPSFVRILSLLSITETNQPMYCVFNETADVQQHTQAARYELCENHDKRFGGYVYSCPVPHFINSRRLEFITISFGKSGSNVVLPLLSVRPPDHRIALLDLFPSRADANDTIVLEKNHNINTGHDSNDSSNNTERQLKTFTFAICVPPMFGNISVHRLVEFIELSRLLGAQHFIFYNHSMTPEISDVLQYYVSKNLASVQPWTLPPQLHNDNINAFVWYLGQLLAHNDCLYRAMPDFDLVAFNDIDEFIVLHDTANNWREVFPWMLADSHCGFSFETAYYNPSNRDPFSTHLLTPLLTERTRLFNTVLRKVMLCPWRVFEVGIHHISKQNREDWLPLQIEPKLAYVHHYRECRDEHGMFCQGHVTDTLIFDSYLRDLTINFNRVLADVSSSRKALGLVAKSVS